jgi:hypothetical protein
MATWSVKESSEGFSVTKTVEGVTTDYGQFNKNLFGLLIGLSEFIVHGDVVVTPEGSYYVKHDKNCYNPTAPTNN